MGWTQTLSRMAATFTWLDSLGILVLGPSEEYWRCASIAKQVEIVITWAVYNSVEKYAYLPHFTHN
jgi:hypothetical protein